MEQFDGDQFGDFKGTLLGLLSAYNYELRILEAATRLMSSDAFATLHSLYRKKAGRVAAPLQIGDAAPSDSAASLSGTGPASAMRAVGGDQGSTSAAGSASAPVGVGSASAPVGVVR
jgi:hypothetical protein